MMHPFHSIELPHTGRMRWIRDAALSPGGATARVTIAHDHPFVRNGCLLPSALIEVMAQAAASALHAPGLQQRVTHGYLVALREFAVMAPVPAGSSLEVTARHERTFGPLSQAFLEVRHWAGEATAGAADGSGGGEDGGEGGGGGNGGGNGREIIASARMTFHLQFE